MLSAPIAVLRMKEQRSTECAMYRYASMLAFAFLLGIGNAEAFTRTWPSGTAPCNTSLQACIEGSAAADTVLVASNDVIAASVFVHKPFVLRAAAGYRPVIGAGFAISGNVNSAGSWSWQVEGFELQQGFIALNVQGGTQANVVVRGNRVLSDISGAAEISIVKNSAISTTINYEIARNQLDYNWNTFDGALRAALQVLDAGSGTSSGRISENRVFARGSQSIGILVSTSDRGHRTEVLGNHVLGGRAGSIFLRQGNLVAVTGGSLTALVLNNVVRSIVPGSHQADGIKVDAYDGALNLTALHNTVVDAFNGIDVFVDATATAGGEIGGNLFAYLTSAGLQRSGGASAISDSDNLFFQSSETPSTAGLSATSVFADPMLKSVPGDPHLRPGSPAIDHLVAAPLEEVLATNNLPRVDGDGLRRFKRGNAVSKSNGLDIGALEAGDETLLHRLPSAAPGNVSIIDHQMLNDFPQALPQQTANWNPDGVGGIYNIHPVSLFYSAARWRLREEDLLPFSASAAFNILAPGAGTGRHEHLNTAGNTNADLTTLNHPDLNGHADYIVLATRNPGTGTVSDVDSPLGVNFAGGAWRVERLDGLPMPANGGFNIYFQEPSSNAFRHRASAGNIFGNTTDIDHPLLNGNRCARFHVTMNNAGPPNLHHIGVFYVGAPYNRWSIFNQDGVTMTVSADFHVVVDPQAVACPDAMFGNGFE
jgi:hypothetical protein